MFNVAIWGAICDFDAAFRTIEPEILKNQIKVVAFAITGSNNYSFWDGIPVCSIQELPDIDCDYIINMNPPELEQVSKIISLLHIEDKIIPVRLFSNPLFSFEKYVELKNSKVSIIAAHCWGGFAYHQLGLKFHSPFINLFLDNEDFLKMSEDFDRYISKEIVYDSEVYQEYWKTNYPVGKLYDVSVKFEHYSGWEETKAIWDKRLERINFDNLFFEMTCRKESEIERFLALPYENKIAFTEIPVKAPQIINVSAEEMDFVNNAKYNGNLGWYMCEKTAGAVPWPVDFDLIKLLLGESDYMRG